MYCRHCGNEMSNESVVCVKCGVPKGKGSNFCPNCGAEVAPEAVLCVNCGTSIDHKSEVSSESKSKLIAGLLGIFLGGWGVHNFYLGFTTKAVVQILLTVFLCGAGSIWGLIEGIMILCGKITTDANGNLLKD